MPGVRLPGSIMFPTLPSWLVIWLAIISQRSSRLLQLILSHLCFDPQNEHVLCKSQSLPLRDYTSMLRGLQALGSASGRLSRNREGLYSAITYHAMGVLLNPAIQTSVQLLLCSNHDKKAHQLSGASFKSVTGTPDAGSPRPVSKTWLVIRDRPT
jgi:hypothetical protein